MDSEFVLKMALFFDKKFEETDLNYDGKIIWEEYSKKNGNDEVSRILFYEISKGKGYFTFSD